MQKLKKAVILCSGGLDSTTCLAMAKAEGFECYALSIDYFQRHNVELDAACKIAHILGAKEHKIIKVMLNDIGGSALTDLSIDVPDYKPSEKIPITYVPARNTIFLAIALSWAEVLEAYDIFYGANAIDYSNYPDCRPEYMQAFEKVANLATKAGVEGRSFKIHAPLINMTKAEVVQAGMKLNVDYSLTVSCYQADHQGRACGRCDSCAFRKKGFKEAGVPDPTRYVQ